MKKTKMIAMTLVVALMAMGAAYAAWTQTVTVNGSIESGELRVEATVEDTRVDTLPIFGNDELADGTEFAVDESTMNGFVETSDGVYVSSDGSNATIEINGKNFYPGMKAEADFAFENVGTIPVKVALADNYQEFGIFDGDYQFFPSPDLVTYEFILEKYEDVTINTWWGPISWTQTILIPMDTFDDLDQALQDMGELEVGDGFKIYLELNVGKNATEEDFPENTTDTYVLPLKFTQFNVN